MTAEPIRSPDPPGVGPDDNPWPGAWRWGVNFAKDTDSPRVIAVAVGGAQDIKYGLRWVGPIDLRQPGMPERLDTWAEWALDWDGGYVHLFPAEGDVDPLEGWDEDEDEDK